MEKKEEEERVKKKITIEKWREMRRKKEYEREE